MEKRLDNKDDVNNIGFPGSTNNYLGEIEGLRAIAVLAVIAFHFNESLIPSGFLGVDIFFVISGYVISASLANRVSNSIAESLLSFYIRRVKRLMPALILCVFVTGFMACIFSPLPGSSIVTAVAALFGLANLNLFRISTDYFGDAAVSNFFTHTWSLGVEEQFYFIFPVLYLLLTRQLSRHALPRLFLFTMALCAGVSLAAYIYAFNKYPDAAFFLLPFRLWELAFGVLIYHGVTHLGIKASLRSVLDARVLSALLLAILFLPKNLHIQATIASVLFTGLLLISIHIRKSEAEFLANKVLTHIGKLSYSLYLWHWSVLVLAYWTVGVSLITAPFLLALIYAISFLSFNFVERPLRHRAWSSHKSIELGYGLAVAVLVSAILIVVMNDRTTLSPLYAGSAPGEGNWNSTSVLLDAQSSNSLIKSTQTKSELEAFEQKKTQCHLTPHRLDSQHPYFGKKPVLSDEFFRRCLQATGKQLVLVGDSFSNVLANHFFVAAHQNGYQVSMLLGYNCPFPLDPANIQWGRGNCTEEAKSIQSALNNHLKADDVLAIILNYTSTAYSLAPLQDTLDSTSFMDKELVGLSGIAGNNNASFVIVGTNATLNSTMPCTRPQWFNQIQCPQNELSLDMKAQNSNDFALKFNQHLVDLFQSPENNTHVLDPIAILCDDNGSSCPVYRDGTLYYRDNDYIHLSRGAADFLYPAIAGLFENL